MIDLVLHSLFGSMTFAIASSALFLLYIAILFFIVFSFDRREYSSAKKMSISMLKPFFKNYFLKKIIALTVLQSFSGYLVTLHLNNEIYEEIILLLFSATGVYFSTVPLMAISNKFYACDVNINNIKKYCLIFLSIIYVFFICKIYFVFSRVYDLLI